MIIKKEIQGLFYTFSNNNKLIRKVGTEEIYIDAYDVLEFEYEEIEIEIEQISDITE